MAVHDPMALAGNVVAFVAVAGKTLYDLWLNPARFRADLTSKSTVDAARDKRDRADRVTGAAFLLLTVSYGILILEAIR